MVGNVPRKSGRFKRPDLILEKGAKCTTISLPKRIQADVLQKRSDVPRNPIHSEVFYHKCGVDM